MIVKEVVCTDENAIRIQHNGIVLKEFNSDMEWFSYKIIGDVAVVTFKDSDGYPVVYGAADADADDGTEVWESINEIAGFSDRAISVVPVDENFRLPEGETIFSPSSIEDGKFSSWALVLYGGQQQPVLYVRYNEFSETSYKKVTSILSKMVLSESDE